MEILILLYIQKEKINIIPEEVVDIWLKSYSHINPI